MLEKITIFSDGSSLGNPGPGGYGVIMRWKDQEIKIISNKKTKTKDVKMIINLIKNESFRQSLKKILIKKNI